MRLVVQKYGGSSVATTAHIGRVADRIVALRCSGARVVVVVSAMGDATDDLLKLAYDIHPEPPARELDMLLTVGERVSMALLSMALQVRGQAAISFTGSQSGIITDTQHADARIQEIRAARIEAALASDSIVIVAGFQGVSQAREITTLGRGGSDTTAVALAAALGASQCDICTDVDGICTADPRVVPNAHVIDTLSYDETIAFAAHGAGVVHPRAAQVARRHNVKLRVCSSFNNTNGTRVGAEEDSMQPIEEAGVRGVTSESGYSRFRVHCSDARDLARAVAAVGASGAALRYVVREGNGTSLAGLAQAREASSVHETLRAALADSSCIEQRDDLATVTVIGSGLSERPAIAALVFETLVTAGIELHLVSSSALTLTCAVSASEADRAVRALHERLGLAG